jgi:ankyrin repeat protein
MNVQTVDGETALIFAAQQRFHKLVNLLVRNGADVNLQTKYSLTALLAETIDDDSLDPANSESVATLVSAGAKINVQDAQGRTPLMGAALYSNMEVVRYLVAHGANLSTVDVRGRTAQIIAVERSKRDIADFLRNNE